jgi:hypothetical protein
LTIVAPEKLASSEIVVPGQFDYTQQTHERPLEIKPLRENSTNEDMKMSHRL